jgi:hypothetical protein
MPVSTEVAESRCRVGSSTSLANVTHLSGHGGHGLPVMHVSLARRFLWLSRGSEDLRRTPRAGLVSGLLVSVLGAVSLGFWRHPYFVAAGVSGFFAGRFAVCGRLVRVVASSRHRGACRFRQLA